MRHRFASDIRRVQPATSRSNVIDIRPDNPDGKQHHSFVSEGEESLSLPLLRMNWYKMMLSLKRNAAVTLGLCDDWSYQE